MGIFPAQSVQAQAFQYDWLVNIDETVTPAPAGGLIEVPINILNFGFGPGVSPATTIEIDVPVGMTFSTLGGGVTSCAPLPAAAGVTVVCNIPELQPSGNPGDNVDLLFGVETTVAGAVTLVANVPAVDNDIANNLQSKTLTMVLGADVVVTVDGPATAAAGEIVDYTFTLTNDGPDPVSNLKFTVPFPSGVTDIVPPAGCLVVGSAYECTIAGPLAVGADIDLVFGAQITAASPSTVTVIGSVSGGDVADPTPENNTGTINTTVSAGSDLAISKVISPDDDLLVGDSVTFTLAGSYTGNPPTGVTITDIFPANYEVTGVSAPAPWDCDFTIGSVECTHPGGAAGGTEVPLGVITVNAIATSDGIGVENTAEIDADGPNDPNPDNNIDGDGGVVIEDPYIDLAARKRGPSPNLAVVGVPFNFNISTANVGNADFYGTVEMIDSVPNGMTINSYNANGWTCTPAAPVTGPAPITCTRVYTAASPLQVDHETPPVTLTTVISNDGSFTNGLHVGSPDGNLPDPYSPNDTIGYGGSGGQPGVSADVSIVKTASRATLPVGETQTFDLEIRNAGPVASLNVQVRDLITNLINNQTTGANPGLQLISYTNLTAADANCSTAPSGLTSIQLVCNIVSVPVCTAGSCPVITLAVVPGGEAGTRSNTATAVSQTTPDPNRSNETSTVTYSVEPRVDITINKVGSAAVIPAGQPITYVLAGINKLNGLSTAQNLTIQDVLPSDLTFVSASSSSGSCGTKPAAESITGPGNNTVICNLGNVANGAEQTVTIVVRANRVLSGSAFTNNASITTDSTQIGVGDEGADFAVTVTDADLDLLVQKTESIDPLPLDDNTVYTLKVRNLGPSASENIVVTDNLPVSGLTFVSASAGAGASCPVPPAGPVVGSTGGTLVCTIDYLAPGGIVDILVEMKGVAKGTASNSVTISSDEILAGQDTNPANNTSTQTTSIRTRTDVEVRSKTASPNPVNLRDGSSYSIQVAVNIGPGLAEADNVVVTDNLPSGLELTGTPWLSVLQGSISPGSSCTGGATLTSFTCDLGSFFPSAGPAEGLVNITVPVRAIAVTANPQTFTNTASISTSSFELGAHQTNNSNSGDLIVRSSTLSGKVFGDFDDDGVLEAGDTNIGGVPITLQGTALDGTTFTRSTTTAADGTYSFGLLPEGSYVVTRGTVPNATYLEQGGSYPFDSNGTGDPNGGTVISAIALEGGSSAENNNFTMVPIARIGIAKSAATAPVINADGSFNQSFSMVVENFSEEALENIEVTDTLSGGAPAFGNLGSAPLAAGQYLVSAAPSGSCGGNNGAFDGDAQSTIASGFTLGSGATCTVAFTLRVQPTIPLPPVIAGTDRYQNQATVTGEGALSGQTSATNGLLSDLSDDGTNADPSNNGSGDGSIDNNPTLMGPVFTPNIALIKEVSTAGLQSPPTVGDTLTYTFTVTNNGPLDLYEIEITDGLVGIVLDGGPIDLASGDSDSVTFTATYDLKQGDINAGEVENTAVVTGYDIYGTEATDDSGTANDNDTPTVATIPQVISLAIIKTADASGVTDPALAGQTITYGFTVKNTGNVTLTDVAVADALAGIELTGSPIAEMLPGAEVVNAYTGSYDIDLDDINAGEVINQATAKGKDPDDSDVSDLSGDTYEVDNPNVVSLAQNPSIALIKTSTTGNLGTPPQKDDVLDFQFAVTNTGSVTLTGITITDLLPGITISGGPIDLDPGESDTSTFTATYQLTQADLDRGDVENSATVSGNPPGGADPVTDDSGTDNETDGPLTTDLVQVSSIDVTKRDDMSALNDPPEDGDQITYTFVVTNTGNQTLTGVVLNDDGLTNGAGDDLTLDAAPVWQDPSDGSVEGTLLPGRTAVYQATYAITTADIDSGLVQNSSTVDAVDPDDNPVGDISDDPEDDTEYEENGDDNPDDPTKSPLTRAPELTVTKTDNIAGLLQPVAEGDVITYTISVTNSGNVTLNTVDLTDELENDDGDIYDLTADLVFVEGSLGSNEGDLLVGEVATYSLEYTLLLEDLNSGAIENTVTATALDPADTEVEDTSDDPDAGPAGPDDPTRTAFEPEPGLEVQKTDDLSALASPTVVGNVITYTIKVKNTGNVTLSGVTLDDELTNFTPSPTPVDLSGDITFGSADQGNAEGTLEPGETATYSLEYALSQDDIDYGGVTNTVTATGKDPFDTEVEDLSDDPTDPTTDTEDPTVSPVTPEPAISVLKLADTSDLATPAAPGQVIRYTVTITNTGNTTLNDVALADSAVDGNAAALILTPPVPGFDSADQSSAEGTLLIGETATYLAEIELTQEIINSASITNNAIGTATSPTGIDVEDASDDPENPADEDPDGNGDPDDPTYTPLAAPELVVLKTDDISGLSTPPEAGEVVTYTITVRNTGNVPLTSVEVEDTLVNNDVSPAITLTTGPTWQSSSEGSAEGALALLETATYTATYELTQDDINSGGILNTAVASAIDPTDEGVTDTSDDPDVTDDVDDNGDGEPDDPTPTTLPRAPSLDITKTTSAVVQQFPFVFDVTYDIAVTNTGNTTANFVQVADDLGVAMDPGFVMGLPEVVLAGFSGPGEANPAYDGMSEVNLLTGDTVLQPGEVGTITLTARINFVHGLTVKTNTAYATSTDVTDPVPSDDPTQTPDDNTDTNPTPPPVVDEELDGSPDRGEGERDRDDDGMDDNSDYDPHGYFYCQENGMIMPGGSITVTGPLGTQSGLGTSNNITVSGDGSDGSFQWFVSVAGTYTMTYDLPPGGVASEDRLVLPPLDLTTLLPANPASLGGSEMGSSGVLSNYSAEANRFHEVFIIEDGDPTIFNNNIPMQFCGEAAVTASKELVGEPILRGDQRTQLVFELTTENTGETRVVDPTLLDDLNAAFGAGNHEVLGVSMISAPDTLGATENTAFDGADEVNLLTTGGILDPGQSVTAQFTVAVAVDEAGTFVNAMVAGGSSPLDGTPIEVSTDEVAIDLLPPPGSGALVATKTAGVGSARLGDTVPYTITFENTQGADFVALTLVDVLPVGFVYQPGSATIDGSAAEPQIEGRRLSWAEQTIAGGTTISLQLMAIVGPGADPNQFVNSSWIEDPETGNIISNVSEAIVRREAEAVFDCSDIIGTVFDDLNHNGYQDGPYDPDIGKVVDQTVNSGNTGKLEVAPTGPGFEGEPGLAGVRLSTDTGTLITTDAHGRYSVPCAALPGRLGENFTLKLDTRTLPSGYRVTTENPRTIRVTAGKFAKLNFGASISHIIDIDLSGRAFDPSSNAPKATLVTGLGNLLDVMKDKPSVLRISYFENGENRADVRQRLDRVERLIKQEWRKRDTRYKLSIERTIKRLQ